MAWHVLGDIVGGLCDVAGVASFRGNRAPSPLPTAPTRSQQFGMMLGVTIALLGCLGFGRYLYQWRWESYLLTQPAARAVIVSATQRQTRSNRFTDGLLDYERQTSAGPVTCKNAPMRFKGWSNDFAVGRTVEVFPQPGSCYRPIYQPDIGDSLTTLLVSLMALPLGIACFGASYSSYRDRRARELRTMPAVDARATADISVKRKPTP